MTCLPPTLLSYSTAVCCLLLSIVSCIGNISIILAVLLDPLRKLRTPFTYFIVNLAVSDLITGTVTMPSAVFAHFKEASGPVPSFLFKLIHVTYFICSTASIMSLAVLSVDRYIAIKWPIRYRVNLRLSRCLVASAIIWVFAGVLSLIYFKVGYIDFSMIFVHVAVVGAFSILIWTYSQVYKILTENYRALQDADRGSQNTDLKRVRTNRKVTKAFLYIILVFLCCYIPVIIIVYTLQFCKNCSCVMREMLRDFQYIIVSSSSAINPFICTIRLDMFRRSIAAIFCRNERTHRAGASNTQENPRDIPNISTSDI